MGCSGLKIQTSASEIKHVLRVQCEKHGVLGCTPTHVYHTSAAVESPKYEKRTAQSVPADI